MGHRDNIKKHIIEENLLEGWVVTALEGGSNYWYVLPDHTQEKVREGRDKREPFSIKMTQGLQEGQAFDIHTDEPSVTPGQIDLNSAIQAFRDVFEWRPEMGIRLLTGQYDAWDADCWFQYAVFGKLIFG